MANWSDPRSTLEQSRLNTLQGAAVDAGLRSYMLSVYHYMTVAVLLTGVVAYWFANSSFFVPLMMSPLRWVVMLAPLGFVMALSFGINRMSTFMAQMLFWAFAVVNGLSMSSIFAVFTGTSIAETFFATAAGFAGLSLIGYTTKKDLSGMGSFLLIGLVGTIAASFINIFMHSGTMSLVISFIGVLLFAGLTAYDTQKIKSIYFHVQGSDFVGKSAVMGALTLYLDFINMFQFLLTFMGDRR